MGGPYQGVLSGGGSFLTRSRTLFARDAVNGVNWADTAHPTREGHAGRAVASGEPWGLECVMVLCGGWRGLGRTTCSAVGLV